MLQKFIRFSFLMVIVMVTACTDAILSPIVDTPASPNRVSFGLVTSPADTIVLIQIAWPMATDAAGDAEFYRHTMTSSKVVTDESTGPLPILKQVNGYADTVAIKIPLVNDTVTLVSKVWSVRRGLQSVNPAEGQLVIIRKDRPPPPPDSITIDTIIIPIMQGLQTPNTALTKVTPMTIFKSIIPFKHEEDGTLVEITDTSATLTILK